MDRSLMESLQHLGESMPGGFFVYQADEEQKILYINDIVLDIFGCSTAEELQELTGNTFKGFVHPDDWERIESSIHSRVLEHSKKLDYVEYRLVRKDGSIRWVDDYGHLVHTEEYGDVYYVLIRDITELHVERDEFHGREEVIEGLSVGFSSIYLLDIDQGTMIPYQQRKEDFYEILSENGMHGYRQIASNYANRYVLPEDRELYLREVAPERIKARLQEEQSYLVNYRCIDGKGTITYMEMSIVVIENDTEYHHVIMGYRDITERALRLQQDLADKLNLEMELEREKHSNEIKSSFLFNISHDIRTPMNAIKGFTDLAKRHIHEPELVQEYLAKVEESNQYLLTLIDDLLEMSRLDYGHVEVRLEACSLQEELEIVLDLFRGLIEEKKLELITEFDMQGQQVYVDTSRFERIMGNLISNAVKFTPQGGTITVKALKKQVSDSGYARFEFVVSDTGVGMTEEFMKRMYEAFEREESSTKTGNLGTGLGLAITKQLLDLLGGSISVESEKGKGSTFKVNLPLKMADETKEYPAEHVQPEEIKRKTGQYRVLLVEDIEINRMLAETLLEEEGFLVESVPDGSDAVEIIKTHPEWYYDVILMDIQMPVMNGYEATRLIRSMGRKDTSLMPIIALSANARDEDKRMSMESGMNSHVAKPFDIAQLIKTINKHLKGINKK